MDAVNPARIIRVAAVLAAAGSVAVAAAPVVWHVLGEDGTLPPAPDTRAPATADAPAPATLDPVLALAPFGRAPVAQPAPTTTAKVELNLELRGIVQARDPAKSIAVIAGPDRTASYVPGETIDGGAVLTRVADGHVILDIDGAEEILTFPLSELSTVTAAVEPEPERPVNGLGARIRVEPQPATRVPKTTEQYIDLWRRRIQRNPQAVLDAIGLIATEDGYVIAEDHDSGVGLAGLQPGDLVARVNGEQVGDVTRDAELYDRIAAAGQARLEIVRDGRTISMSFPLR